MSDAAPSRRPFLTAAWRDLAILSWEVEPALLEPHVPAGTELDRHEERVLVSLVGFLFRDTRVGGIAIPGHRDFEEVNLRGYVRRREEGAWRRGVAFIREVVPRRAIAWTARLCYGEPYVALPMRHRHADDGAGRRLLYAFGGPRHERRIELRTAEPVAETREGSLEAFIVEHYWGYTRRRRGTGEYRVEHPPWRVAPAAEARLVGDVADLYGAALGAVLRRPPDHALLAEGSTVAVHRGTTIRDAPEPAR